MNDRHDPTHVESAEALLQAITLVLAFEKEYGTWTECPYEDDGEEIVHFEIPVGLKADEIEEFNDLDAKLVAKLREMGMYPPPPVGIPLNEDEHIIGLTGLRVCNRNGNQSLPHERNILCNNHEWRNIMEGLLRVARSIIDTKETIHNTSAQSCRLEVELDDNSPQIRLDGQPFAVEDAAAKFVQALIDVGRDVWLTPQEFETRFPEVPNTARVSRIKKKLPKEIVKLIDSSSGKGSRLISDAWSS